ncbi:uncharacterized protein SPPG_04141 [Spizellomyces punctatus DAOM BR117]|uniref:Mpv17/PMP22 family protein n=1 Tax=Spizellomyces punctatus (strain DAOM BR117) TaxID=645134 RepID=A0A0L0HJ42_SPIPD|nr:uncharacterized protein SPPG_04141 [Spizellomyces punctatus DAOM BR117]KND01048.1 hypothetical protein SPPG_04141 [Spizellomyces punctatus DAOM BR117]|eukprot:XP_016609087.1 hypothetical protein SPPG_04141 [Spizellomyces punctatus DAOM BR117]
MAAILGAYSRFLTNWRYTSQSLTAGTLWFAGDLISQKLVEGDQKEHLRREADREKGSLEHTERPGRWEAWGVDWRRVLTMTSFGVCFAGPLYTFWYRLLDDKIVGYFERMVKRKIQSTTTLNVPKSNLKWKIALTKVVADMVIFDPPFLGFFFISTHLLSGYSFQSGVEQMKRDVLPTYAVDVAVWTPIQLVNFRWIPVLYQPVVVNSVNVGWNAYLSYVKHRDEKLP